MVWTMTGPGNNSWPITSYVWLMLYGTSQTVCTEAAELNAFIYWTQTSSDAQSIADRYILVVFP